MVSKINTIKLNTNPQQSQVCYHKNGNIKYIYYYQNYIRHRDDGPAEILYYENGNLRHEKYYINDYLHRDDGPAIIIYYDNKQICCEYYCKNNIYHREDGPAIIRYHENGDIKEKLYLINGKSINIEGTMLKYNDIIQLINKSNDIDELLKIKLIINVKFNKDQYLLDLIDSKLILIKLS